MNKTIKLYGFSRNDELVFTSLISLLSNKTPCQWDVVADPNAQVAVVDIDQYSDQAFLSEIKKCSDQIVSYGNRQLDDSCLVLAKPLRAASILKCLSSLSGGEAVLHPGLSSPQAIETVYRLQRWPDSNILKSSPGSARMCAVLIKHATTLKQIAAMVDIPDSDIESFLSACRAGGYLIEKERTVIAEPIKKEVRPLNPILSKLRAKFGAKA